MSVRPHPTKGLGWWIIDVYLEGRKPGSRQKIAYMGSEADAMLQEADLRRQVNRAPFIAPTLKELTPDYLLFVKNNRSSETLRDLIVAFKPLLSHFGRLKPSQVSPGIVEQYKNLRLNKISERKKRPVTKRTIAKELSYLSGFIKWAVKNSHAISPTHQFERFPKNQTKPPMPIILTLTEIGKIQSQLKPPVKHIFELMAYCGLRMSEAFHLKAGSVRDDGKFMVVFGKGEKERTVPVSVDFLQNTLRQAAHGRHIDEILFPNPKTGNAYVDIRKSIGTACQKAGLKNIYNHLLRHSFATAAVMSGVNVKALQSILGHVDPQTMDLYIHLSLLQKCIQETE